MNLKGKNVLVVGLGRSGLAAAKLLAREKAQVTVVDQQSFRALSEQVRRLPKSIRFIGGSKQPIPGRFDLMVVSPGVGHSNVHRRSALKRGIPVWSELELGWHFSNHPQTIAVTGTNGKTTTTALIGHLLKSNRRRVVVAGNIGTPLSSVNRRLSSQTTLVLEVSSYQLETIDSFRPNVAVLLNITPDHLARHSTMASYARAKSRIFENQTATDTAVLNGNDRWCRAISRRVRARKAWFPTEKLRGLAAPLRLPGKHNQENAMAAAAAVLAAGMKENEILRAMRTFRGVRHRIQHVGTFNGVRYINDSKGTNVDSTLVALKSLEGPLIVIMGGEHKGTSYRALIPELRAKAKAVLTIGEASSIIANDLRGSATIVPCQTLARAVSAARTLAVRGDTVLLSPACASFDQFKNFEDRGDSFVRLVKKRRR